MRISGLLTIIIILLFSSCSCNREKKELNNVVIRISQDPRSLNPVDIAGTTSLEIINLLYQSLISIDREKLKYVPLLIENLPEVQKKDSVSVFSFRIRNEAEWSKEKAITGEDVFFSLKLHKCLDLADEESVSPYEFIREVKVDSRDKKKFQIICDPYNTDMDLMTGDFAVLPEHIVDPEGLLRGFTLQDLASEKKGISSHPKITKILEWFNSDRFTRNKEFLRGSGGYELEEWKTDQYVRLRKKENWWGDKLNPANPYITAKPNRIVYQIIPENSTGLQVLKKEQIDVYGNIPITTYNQLAADKDFRQKYQLFTPETHDVTFVGLNARLAKFADKNTRQAIAHLFEVDKILKATQGKFAIRTNGFIVPANTFYYNHTIVPYDFNLSKASNLLRAAGWEKNEQGWQKRINGQWEQLQISLNYKAGNTEFETIALIFQQAAAKLNIPVNIRPMEGTTLFNNLRSHEFEMFIRTLSGNPFVLNFEPFLHTEEAAEGGSNVSGFGTAETDRLLNQINQAQDLETKAKLLKQFQQILHEQSNLIFLYTSKDRLAIHKRFTNLMISGIKPGYDVSAFTLQAE